MDKIKPRRKKKSFPRFNLEPLRSDKTKAYIFLIYRYAKDVDGKHIRLKYGLSEIINVSNWIPHPTQRLKKSAVGTDEILRVNSLLDSIDKKCLSIVKESPYIPVDDFRLELDYFLRHKRRPEPKKAPSFFEFIEAYLEEQETIMNKGTLGNFKGTFKHLKNYAKTIKICLLS